MGRMSHIRIIEMLEEAGYSDAAKYLKHRLRRDVKFTKNHDRVLILLYFLGAFDKPLKVPQRASQTDPNKRLTRPLDFWNAIEWLYDGAANTFKARFNELKANTDFVESRHAGEYGITYLGVQKARELIEYNREARNYLYDLMYKVYDEDTRRAQYFRHVLSITGNFHPIREENIRAMVV